MSWWRLFLDCHRIKNLWEENTAEVLERLYEVSRTCYWCHFLVCVGLLWLWYEERPCLLPLSRMRLRCHRTGIIQRHPKINRNTQNVWHPTYHASTSRWKISLYVDRFYPVGGSLSPADGTTLQSLLAWNSVYSSKIRIPSVPGLLIYCVSDSTHLISGMKIFSCETSQCSPRSLFLLKCLQFGRRGLNLRDKFTKMSYGVMIEQFVLRRLIQIFGMWLLGQYWTSCTRQGPGMPLLSMALRLQNTSIKLLMVRHVSRERAIPPETNQDHNVKGSRDRVFIGKIHLAWLHSLAWTFLMIH